MKFSDNNRKQTSDDFFNYVYKKNIEKGKKKNVITDGGSFVAEIY